MDMPSQRNPAVGLAARLRAAGCVFAEDEAAILIERAAGDDLLLEELTRARIAGAPLEALVGWVEFGGVRLTAGPGVFVPRQRTLQLSERAIEEVRSRMRSGGRPPVFLEAFAGIAPVAAAVQAAVAGATILACDGDAAARELAECNLGSAAVYATDVLEGLPEGLREGVDVIAAVPPYVPEGEIDLLPREARDYEPRTSLAGGADGLTWVRALIGQAPAWLAPGGRLLIEMHREQCGAANEHARTVGLALSRPPGAAARPEGDQTVVLELGRPKT